MNLKHKNIDEVKRPSDLSPCPCPRCQTPDVWAESEERGSESCPAATRGRVWRGLVRRARRMRHLFVTCIVMSAGLNPTHPVFSASGRLRWSWFRLGKPPSSCTASQQSSSSPSRVHCRPCTANKRERIRGRMVGNTDNIHTLFYSPIWRTHTFGDTTLISSFKNRYFPTSLWNLLPQFFIHASNTWRQRCWD